MLKAIKIASVFCLLLVLVGCREGDPQVVAVHALHANEDNNGIGEKIGYIEFSDSNEGLRIKPVLEKLSPGFHGFHIHEAPSCESMEKEGKWVAGLKAKGHFDPHASGKHLGPKGHGHLGDLPALEVDESGKSYGVYIAPRLKLKDLTNRSVMIHAGGDNFSDEPSPLGGGGARVACGVINRS